MNSMNTCQGVAPVVKRTLLEGFVIVGSILLAFAIDAAWDRSQEGRARAELGAAVLSDFIATRESLAETIPLVEENLRRADRFNQIVIEDLDVPLDSLRFYFAAVFGGLVFQPSLSSYDGAISSGRLAEISNSELRAAFSAFDAQRAFWDGHLNTLFHTHYAGPTWELRRRIGTDAVITRPALAPPSLRLSEVEMRRLLDSPESYAAAEVHSIIFRNIRESFARMDSAAAKVVEILEGGGGE